MCWESGLLLSLTHNVKHIMTVWCVTMGMKDYERLKTPE